MIKNLIRTVFFFLFILIVISCKKDEEECTSEEKNSGIIVNSVSFGDCDDSFAPYSKFYVINDDIILDTLMVWVPDCSKPEIDFEQQTLLGLYTYGACTASFFRNVEMDSTNTQYIYTVKVESCGSCNYAVINMNWVVVPKLPNEWGVSFIWE